jgi:CheY-like chemotaxis protein
MKVVDSTARRHITRILVAEGDEDTRTLYRAALHPLNFDVVDAADGRQALVSALSHPPNLLLCETNLLLIDGYSLCELLRRDAATRHVAILVVTGESRPSALDRARRVGVDSILVKPCSPEVLVAEVIRLCDPRRRERRDLLDSVRSATTAKALLTRSHERYETTAPPLAPPRLVCSGCDCELSFVRSHIGGVNEDHAEQWDHFRCERCRSLFEYRHRTRKLREVG